MKAPKCAMCGPVGALLLTLASSGCPSPTCDRTQGNAIRFSEGTTNQERTYYTTSAPDEPFLVFSAGRTYRLEHGLGAVPETYEARLSFSPCPFSEEEPVPAGERPRCKPITDTSHGTGAAETAGNQVIYERLTDKVIEVRNDTCADFYLRVWATAPAESREGTRGDAGAAPADAGTP